MLQSVSKLIMVLSVKSSTIDLVIHNSAWANVLRRMQLHHYDNEGDTFLDRIIIGDKIWLHYYEPENEHQSIEWKYSVIYQELL